MKNFINWRFLLLLLVFVGVVVGVVFYRIRPQPIKQPAPSRVALLSGLTPLFPNGLAQEQPEYVATPKEQFPTKLPSLVVSSGWVTKEVAQTRAGLLGFSGEPTIASSSRGIFYSWQKGGETLSVGGDPIEISYSAGASPGPVISKTKSELSAAATAFLKKVSIPEPPIALSETAPLYFAPVGNDPNELDGPTGATLTQLNFAYQVGGVPIFSRLPDVPAASVQLDARGEVVSLVAYVYPNLALTERDAPVAPINTGLARLKSGSGRLLLLEAPGDKNRGDLPNYHVLVATIRSAQLGYYYSPGQGQLSPIFVFRGETSDSRTGNPIRTTTVVSALP